jgi:hypothetical protein
MQPKPPNPPQPAPEPQPETTLDTSPQSYYQAIGWLRGKLVQEEEEERLGIQIRDVTFPLYLPKRVLTVASKLLNQHIWLKCYPQSKGEGLSFKGIWLGAEQNEKGEAGIFVLRGVWQFIPQCRRPVFSIYRNELKNYENRPTNQHLPLIWADQPPYRFRKDSEERPKFYQITARLIPQRGCFGFVSQIAEPIDQTPKRVKKTPPEGGGYPPHHKAREKEQFKNKNPQQELDNPMTAKENTSAMAGDRPLEQEMLSSPTSIPKGGKSPSLELATPTPEVVIAKGKGKISL